MHPFFSKRKEIPGGGGKGAGALKAFKTSSTASAGGSTPWSALHDSLLARVDPACLPNARIAAFDLDDTLQKTKSGKPGYMAQIGDFIHWSVEVAPKLRELHAQGYKIVIFTNQGSVKGALQGKRAEVVRTCIDQLAAQVGVPMQAFAATQKGPEKDPMNYRKPLSGMWSYMVRECNGGVEPDLSACYYVGDAAGRPGDHSDSDKAFARAVGMAFFTPEEFFVKEGAASAAMGKDDDKGLGSGEDGSAAAAAVAGVPVVVVDDDDDVVEVFDRAGTP